MEEMWNAAKFLFLCACVGECWGQGEGSYHGDFFLDGRKILID